MKQRWEIRLSGTGGQGLILAGLILAEAAAIYDDKNALQSQSYGPQARGGLSKSELIISSGDIDYPKVQAPDILLAMSQEAADHYSTDLRKDAVVIVDSQCVDRLPTRSACALPITEIACRATGHTITASMAAIGIIAGLTDVVSRDALLKAVAARAPKGTEDMNCRAVEAGFDAADECRVAREMQSRTIGGK
ncbi:MAG: 2-oxoacid:acceptor oxidoreductase family protein [Chloroflexi bacterium]|nr:2-oxoacid:acceptor oxidoreductase family protein [Chloroflexota bacterium]